MERVQSLRTRKPQQGRSQKLSKPPPASPSAAALANDDAPPPKARPRPRDRKSRVDDKIKQRRISMRYAISEPTDASGVPDVPALPIPGGSQPRAAPAAAASKPRTDDKESKRDPKAIDVHILDKEEFNPDAYLKVKLASSTESEIKSLQSLLEGAKVSNSNDLQNSVVKNYAEFFHLSKEISTLENDLLELKGSLSEWKSMPSLLHIDDSNPIDRRRTNRSSVADLKVLYADQISALHTRIEGSSKFVPATPGRHIVSETSDITSLNSATYKPEQSVHFVLLDDALLVARNRRRRDERDGRLAAIRCWNLADIVVLDIKDSSELSNVFKIKDGKNVHVFRTDKQSDKRSLLSSFREVASEFSAKKRKQRQTEHERRRSVWTGNGRPPPDNGNSAMPAMPTLSSWLTDMAADMAKDESQDAKERYERDMKWVNEYADNLAIAIALRDWDEAVSLVESGEERLTATPSLSSKLPALKTSLIRALLATLGDPSHRKASVVHLTSLLIRLGSGISARITFLSTRTDLLRKRIRMIVFEGDTAMYIGELAMVVFTSIKHSADWYFGSFREHESASTFVQWAKEQVQVYVDMFKTQAYNSDVSPSTVDECIQITFQQSRRLLGENGLDFSFLLDQILVPPQESRMPAFRKRLSTNRLLPLQSPDSGIKLHLNGNGTPSPNTTTSPRPRQGRTMAVPPRSVNRPGSVIDRS